MKESVTVNSSSRNETAVNNYKVALKRVRGERACPSFEL